MIAFLLMLGAGHVEASGGQLTVTWTDDSANEIGFSLERSAGTTGPFAEISTVGTGVTTYTDSSVADATTYCYRVRAFNDAGYSAYSNVACGATSQGAIPVLSQWGIAISVALLVGTGALRLLRTKVTAS